MFYFKLKKISVINNKLKIENHSVLNPVVYTLLEKFETIVFDSLSKVYDFKYVQSTIKAKDLFDDLKKDLDNNLKIEMITQHPNYTAGILINNLIPNIYKGVEVFVLYFIDDFGKTWKNSQTKSSKLIFELKELLEISDLKKDIEINVLEISGSEKLVFSESQIGADDKRWKLKK